MTEINIPPKIKEIPPLSFSNCYSLEKIDLSSSNVEKIGWGAFSGCRKMEEAILNEKISFIGEAAFEGTKSLRQISIPENTNFIGQDAFLNCYSLENIDVQNENNKYKSVEGVLYTKDMSILIKYPESKNTDIFEVPKEVEKLTQFSMSNMKFTQTVVLNENIKTIPVGAFSESTNLEKIQSVSPIEKVGHLAFSDCSNLEEIHFKETVDIGKFAFSGCDKLTLDKIKITETEATKSKNFELEL